MMMILDVRHRAHAARSGAGGPAREQSGDHLQRFVNAELLVPVEHLVAHRGHHRGDLPLTAGPQSCELVTYPLRGVAVWGRKYRIRPRSNRERPEFAIGEVHELPLQLFTRRVDPRGVKIAV